MHVKVTSNFGFSHGNHLIRLVERIHTRTLYLCLFYGSYSYNDEAFTAWVNRFANAGDAAMEIAGNTALRVSYWSFLFFFTELHLAYPIFPKCFHISLYLLFIVRTMSQLCCGSG